MLARFVVIALAVMGVAACVPMPKQAPSPPPVRPEANATAATVPVTVEPLKPDAAATPAAVPAPAEPAKADAAAAPAAAPPGEPEIKWMPAVDVRAMKCSMLNAASDDDKAYASTFLVGYHSGLARVHVLDTKEIDAVSTAGMADCATNPDAVASKVFAAAQFKIERGNAPPAPQPGRRGRRPVTPVEAPPMRYAPAPDAPASDEPDGPPPSENSPVAPPSNEKPPQPPQ